MKKLKKIKLNQKSLIERIDQGKMKMLTGGYSSFSGCLAGCGCGSQTACSTCWG